MSTIGIVCEYNPFHKGHEYQINEAKRLTGATRVVGIMSGSFLQRGTPAIADKYLRTRLALSCGVNAIFEIPFVYATASARDYAYYSVSLMNALGCIDYIAFGAEEKSLDLLSSIASVINHEPECVSEKIRELSASGISYGAARAAAIAEYMSLRQCIDPDELKAVMASPNSILAIEYLCALEKTHSDIKPLLIQRTAAGYNDVAADSDICSAAAIRSILSREGIYGIRRHVPGACYDILSANYNRVFPIYDDSLSVMLSSARIMNSGLSSFADMDVELSNRLSSLDINQSFSETARELKCRNYTMTHINRALLHTISGLTKEEYAKFKTGGGIFYAKLLGLKEADSDLVRRIKKSASVPVITKASEINKATEISRSMYSFDVKATRIYSSMVYQSYKTGIKDDFRQPVIVI